MDDKCKYCGHSFSKHCKGNERHSNYKDELRQVRNPRTIVCGTRHCLEPLCDCTVLVGGKR